MEAQSPWDFAGMDRISYSKLPWPEMRKILIRQRGIYVNDTCSGCGHRLDLIAEQRRKEALPPELREHPFGLLLQAYFEHNAEDFATHSKYPHAVLSCGHDNKGGTLK